jgi:membrane dipeptidase
MSNPTNSPSHAGEIRLMSRREAVRSAGAVAGAALFAPMIGGRRFRLFPRQAVEYSRRCVDLVTGSLVIDMLAPLTINNEMQQRWGPSLDGFTEDDFREFRASDIDVFSIAVGVGGRSDAQAHLNVLNFVGAYNSVIANRPDVFVRIDSAADLDAVHGSGKIGILIGVQNSDHFRTPSDVGLFHAQGQRVSQLTYNARNRIGNGSTERVDGGISDFGVSIVEAMNDVGMAVDVSHSGDRTSLDACEISSRPVLFTHSNSRVLSGGHPRTKTDAAIRAMAETGGVMGITGVRMFVKAEEPTTVEHFLDHYDHVRDLVGVEHLGIGSDIDLHGYDDLPEAQNRALRAGYKDSYAFRDKIDIEGIDHPQRVFDLAEGLIRRGYTDEHIRGILGGNFARVLTEIWAT